MSQLKLNLNRDVVEGIAQDIQAVYATFDAAAFVGHACQTLDALELKERSAVIAEALHEHLPAEYPQAIAIVMQILGDPLDDDARVTQSFYRMMPLAHFVEVYGLDHFAESVEAMLEITKRFSSEFAIRPYLMRYQDQLLPILHEWTQDPNEHVRRLVSEGTRTRLPWASRLPQFIIDPAPVIALLDKLKDDPSLYVRRSVANNLNDIGKDHPDVVLALVERWSHDADDNRWWIIKHALRNFIKQGNPRALVLLGYDAAAIELQSLTASEQVQMPGKLEFSFDLHNPTPTPQNLMIDFIVHFVKANGSTAPKVFKLTSKIIDPQETLTITKAHPLKPITTRTYYPGRHRVEVQVNGQVLGGADFTLLM